MFTGKAKGTADLAAVGAHIGTCLEVGHWKASLRTGNKAFVDFSDAKISAGNPEERALNACVLVYVDK